MRSLTCGKPFADVYPNASSRDRAASATRRAVGGAGVDGWPTSMCSTSAPPASMMFAALSTSMTLKPATPSPRVEEMVLRVTCVRRLDVALSRSMVVIALCCRCLHFAKWRLMRAPRVIAIKVDCVAASLQL